MADYKEIANNIWNSALGDVVYGANRTLNGLTGGGIDYLGDKYGIDTRMNDYLAQKELEGTDNIARHLGNMAQIGGIGFGLNAGLKAGLNALRAPYNAWQIGRAYDRLKQNPFQGSGHDVIATMKNHSGEPVVLQRGEVMHGKNGEIITAGKPLLREYGTKRNYGLNKVIHKHNIPKNEAVQMPRYIKNKPVDMSLRGQSVYEVSRPDGRYRIIVSPTENGRIISSMYKIGR